MANKENFAFNRIKAVLAEKHVLNQDLAAALEVTTQAVSAWCTNSKQPSVKTLYDIAKFLKVDIRELLVPTSWPKD
ncbi:helix-turn-helix transcriptional regulator [Deminuibacter soli]|uniref:XRE family transcriptional regulator n=1 Tax=Deminuibacter soli TaxID=2291815 RepID=A0A3E1NGU4_9BACT|nr:helix-turn-helix transcriptional regulator [Deminuibacter soli]RFM27169.1 XRE family transcriptional regulator [Deminuibacter soli]